MRRNGLLFIILVVFTGFSFSPAFAADFQSLVCKWESAIDGEGWKASMNGLELKGDLYIKIKKVEGNKVWGEMYIDGSASYHRQWLKFVATLSEINGGAAIDFQLYSFMIVRLEVRGDRMIGTGLATAVADFNLKKAASCN